MRHYQIVKPLELPKGTQVRLQHDSQALRRHLITPVGDGFELRTALGFKAGETIGLAAGTAKALGDALQPLEADAPDPPPPAPEATTEEEAPEEEPTAPTSEEEPNEEDPPLVVLGTGIPSVQPTTPPRRTGNR